MDGLGDFASGRVWALLSFPAAVLATPLLYIRTEVDSSRAGSW